MKLIVLIFFISINIVFSQNVWEFVYLTPLIHEDIEILDSSTIFIIESNGLRNNVYKSQNQGVTWELLFNSFELDYLCQNISVPDKKNIYISFNKGIFYQSDNGGESFKRTSIDFIKSFESIAMRDKNIGMMSNCYIENNIYHLAFTKDGWRTLDTFALQNDSNRLSYIHPLFKNDSIITCIVGNSRGKSGLYFSEFNINTFDLKLYWIGVGFSTMDLCKVNDNIYFTCGGSNSITGGTEHDAIHKSTDGGKTWRRLLDLYSDLTKFYGHRFSPFALQSIAFKDSLTGIAVGQFGKILYTYDGGESWIYESKLHDSLEIRKPAVMLVRFAGSIPIIGTYSGLVFRIIEDNLAPKPEDTITISGRVWECDKGQPGIPVVLGYRVTMTDSNGYYKFTRVAKGNYVV